MAFPQSDVILSHILVVDDMERTVAWYRDVLGATLFREYPATAVFEINGAWLVLVTGGGPTADKPEVTMATMENSNRVHHSMTFRVADCRAVHAELEARGATFLTPPVETEGEIRAFFRDPDGHLFEISEAKV